MDQHSEYHCTRFYIVDISELKDVIERLTLAVASPYQGVKLGSGPGLGNQS